MVAGRVAPRAPQKILLFQLAAEPVPNKESAKDESDRLISRTFEIARPLDCNFYTDYVWRCSWCGTQSKGKLCPQCGKEDATEIGSIRNDPIRCDRCGVRAFEGEVFVKDHLPENRVRHLCPECHAHTTRWRQNALYALIYLVALGAVVSEITSGQRLADNSTFFFSVVLLLQWFMTIPHELGHAVAARFFGFSGIRIFVGYGKPLVLFRLFGFKWAINRIPFGGLTFAHPGQNFAQWKWVLYISGGLLVNLIFVIICLIVLGGAYWRVEPTLITALLYANAFVILENIIPYTIATPEGILQSDGKLLVDALRGSTKLPNNSLPNDRLVGARRLLKKCISIILAFATVVFFAGAICALCFQQRADGSSPRGLVALLLVLGIFSTIVALRTLERPLNARSATQLPRQLVGYGLQEFIARSIPVGVSPDLSPGLIMADPAVLHTKVTNLLQKYPNNPGLLFYRGIALTALGKQEEAHAIWEQLQPSSEEDSRLRAAFLTLKLHALILLAEPDSFAACFDILVSLPIPDSQKLLHLDALACAPLYNEITAEKLPAALELGEVCARKALDLAPGRLTLKGTLGGLLVERGDLDQAEPLLRACYEGSSAIHDQGICAFYLAAIASQKGEKSMARILLQRSTHLYAAAWLARKVTASATPVTNPANLPALHPCDK